MRNKANSDDRKHFVTLRANLAFHGYGLARTDPEDGPQRLYLERNGVVVPVKSIEQAVAYLERLNAAATTLPDRK